MALPRLFAEMGVEIGSGGAPKKAPAVPQAMAALFYMLIPMYMKQTAT